MVTETYIDSCTFGQISGPAGRGTQLTHELLYRLSSMGHQIDPGELWQDCQVFSSDHAHGCLVATHPPAAHGNYVFVSHRSKWFSAPLPLNRNMITTSRNSCTLTYLQG